MLRSSVIFLIPHIRISSARYLYTSIGTFAVGTAGIQWEFFLVLLSFLVVNARGGKTRTQGVFFFWFYVSIVFCLVMKCEEGTQVLRRRAVFWIFESAFCFGFTKGRA